MSDFEEFLRGEGYTVFHFFNDGHLWAGVKPLLFHWTLIVGMTGERTFYDDRWCYADEARAHAALAEWKDRNFQAEPTGWRRHTATGRRSNDDGDPKTEWIAP